MAPSQKMCIFCAEFLNNIPASQDNPQNRENFSELVNVWKLLGFPIPDLEHRDLIGACDFCSTRINYLLSSFRKAIQLESQINEILNQIYADLQNDFLAVVEEDVRENLQPFIEHREKAIEDRRHFVCELRPVSAASELFDVQLLVCQDQPEAETASIPEDDRADSPDGFDATDFFLTAIHPEVPVEDETGVFVCDYQDTAEGQKCCSVFNEKSKFDAHVASHSLRIHLSQETVRNYMPRLLRNYWKNTAGAQSNKRFKCPHLDCIGSEKMLSDAFAEHLKDKHALYVCTLTPDCVKRRELFDFEEELRNHVEFAHNEIREEGFYPIETASENLLKCSGCLFSKRASKFRWEFGAHLIRAHKHYVCLHEVECRTCLHSFPTREALIVHSGNKHGLPMDVDWVEQTLSFLDPGLLYKQCFVCGQIGLTSSATYVQHMKEQHGLLMCGRQLASYIKCTGFCQQVFDTENLLELHQNVCGSKRKSEMYPAYCKCCKRILSFADRNSWLKHAKDDHNGLVCDIQNNDTEKFCDQMTLSRIEMKHHMEEKHCSELALDSMDSLALKLYSDGLLDEVPGLPIIGPAVCLICSQSFANFDQEWAQHVRSHGWSICDIQENESSKPCLQLFRTTDQLRAHISSAHISRSTSSTYCPQCNRNFEDKSKFLEHMAKHSGSVAVCAQCGRARSRRSAIACICSKTLECDLCAKTFVSETSLRQHKKNVHEGRRKIWPCENCEKQFSSLSLRNQHLIKVHKVAGEKAHVCSECQKSFSSQGLRDLHFRRAHGPRNFKCDKCDWAFRTTQQLKLHIQKVHECLRPFICDMCGGTFKNNGQLQEHLKKHESGLIKKAFKPRDRRPLKPPSTAIRSDADVAAGEPMDLTGFLMLDN